MPIVEHALRSVQSVRVSEGWEKLFQGRSDDELRMEVDQGKRPGRQEISEMQIETQ